MLENAFCPNPIGGAGAHAMIDWPKLGQCPKATFDCPSEGAIGLSNGIGGVLAKFQLASAGTTPGAKELLTMEGDDPIAGALNALKEGNTLVVDKVFAV